MVDGVVVWDGVATGRKNSVVEVLLIVITTGGGLKLDVKAKVVSVWPAVIEISKKLITVVVTNCN